MGQSNGRPLIIDQKITVFHFSNDERGGGLMCNHCGMKKDEMVSAPDLWGAIAMVSKMQCEDCGSISWELICSPKELNERL